MGISINSYEIQKGDTLESIAGNLGISVAQLRRYHNTYCELSQLLGNDLKGHQNILIPSKEEIEKLAQENINIAQNQALPYLISSHFYSDSYQVSENILRGNENIVDVQYFIDIKNTSSVDKTLMLSISKRDFTKNGKKIDDKVFTLSTECFKSISPFNLVLSSKGEIQDVYQYDKLIRVFKDEKERLKDLFVGEINHWYIDIFEKTLQNKAIFINRLKSDFLYQFLLVNMDWFHKKEPWYEEFYILSKKIKVRLTCNYHYNDNEVITEFIGEMIDIPHNIIDGMEFYSLAGSIKICYVTKRSPQILQSMQVEVSFNDMERQYFQHCIKIKSI